jgi:hypothetical protein
MPERNSSKVWKVVSAWILLLLYLTFTGTVFAGDLELNKVKSAIRERRARWVAGETSVSKLPEEEKLRRVGLIKPEIVEVAGHLQRLEPWSPMRSYLNAVPALI